jgi:probable rRNA maturation factor
MSIQFHTIEVKYSLKNKRLIKQWINEAISQEKRHPGDINIIFCSDAYLLQMNNDYLQHDYYTDIITFDYSEDGVLNGDLFISIDRVKENARNVEAKLQNEMQRVIIHGIMHLCGYKDKKKSDKELMTKMENIYLRKLENITC